MKYFFSDYACIPSCNNLLTTLCTYSIINCFNNRQEKEKQNTSNFENFYKFSLLNNFPTSNTKMKFSKLFQRVTSILFLNNIPHLLESPCNKAQENKPSNQK